MSHKNHPLFAEYPLNGKVILSIGEVPTPYHVYDGAGVLIGGTADLNHIRELLEDEAVYPMQTVNGRAVMAVWAVDFTDASLGPHNELQFSILVSHQPLPPIEDHPLTLLKALFINPDARMFCYGLWNNTETAVCYNREYLGLDAQLTQGHIRSQNGQKQFNFVDEAGDLLFEGSVREAKKASPQAGWSLLRLLGLRQTIRALAQPYLAAKVVNPISSTFPYNGDAQSYLAADTPIVQRFDASTDTITFNPADAQRFDFQPQFIEHFAPFRFVYLDPVKPG